MNTKLIALVASVAAALFSTGAYAGQVTGAVTLTANLKGSPQTAIAAGSKSKATNEVAVITGDPDAGSLAITVNMNGSPQTAIAAGSGAVASNTAGAWKK